MGRVTNQLCQYRPFFFFLVEQKVITILTIRKGKFFPVGFVLKRMYKTDFSVGHSPKDWGASA